MITKEQKAVIVSNTQRHLELAQAVLIAENKGLSAAEFSVLRREVKANGGRAQVIKNTLAKRAFAGSVYDSLNDSLHGTLVYAIAEDVPAVTKVLSNTAKINKNFILRGGILASGTLLQAADIDRLALIPSREELLSSLLGTMMAPVAKFVRTLNEIPTSFARVLSAIAKKKDE